MPPYGAAGPAAIQDLRSHLDHAAPGSLVGGGPAIQYDITQAARPRHLLLFPLVFAVIFVIIAVLLQAIVAPLVLVASTALSFAAAFGLADLVWRYGFGYAGVEAAVAAVHLHLPGRARGGLQHLPQRADPGRSPARWAPGRARCAGSASPAA